MTISTPNLRIAVLDRGFVYVGMCHVNDSVLVITSAQCVRRWGTENGLGQLATSGPTAKTKLDAAGTIRAPLTPLTALIHLIDCTAAAWPTFTAQAA